MNRVTAATAGAKKPRRAEGQRVEKSTHLGDRQVTVVDRSTTTVSLFSLAIHRHGRRSVDPPDQLAA